MRIKNSPSILAEEVTFLYNTINKKDIFFKTDCPFCQPSQVVLESFFKIHLIKKKTKILLTWLPSLNAKVLKKNATLAANQGMNISNHH